MARARISDKDIERLLSGSAPADSKLAPLAPLVDWILAERDRPLSPERISAFARAAAGVAAEPGTASGTPTLPVRSPRRRLRTKLALSLAFVMLASTLSGVAIAAEASIPGDALHGLKLALENFGIGRGGVEERLSEATELASRGMHDVALAHAAAAIAAENDDTEIADAVTGLEDAIGRLQTEVPGESNEVRGRVAEMLQWMLDNAGLIGDPEAEPGAFGRGVAALARQIGGGHGDQDDPGDEGVPDDTDFTDEGNRGLGGPPKGTPGPPTEGIPPNRP